MLAVVIVAAAGILFFFDPAEHAFYPVCFFHRTTGLLCPGCGSLRALHQLSHGHLVAAFRFNPLLMLCLPFAVWWTIRFAVRKLKRQPTSVNLRPVWIGVSLAATVAFSVWRNIPGSPFAALPR